MVSMKDISIKCGVSVATVSKALNGQSDVGKQTAQHIRSVAKEMGYLPNAAARALKTNRTNNLGVLFVDNMQSGLMHEYFSSLLDSIKTEAERSGYDITFISNNIGQHKMSYLEHCRYRACDGVVIACADFNDPDVVELVQSEIPVVTIDHVFNEKTAILSNNVQCVRDLVTYIVKQGHKKIAFIHGEDTSVTQKRIASFHRTCQEYGIAVSEAYIKSARYHDPASSAEATRQLLSLADRPTCIMYPDDFSFMGGRSVLDEMELKIPEDISVAGFDGIFLSRVLQPVLTTVRQDTVRIGREAACRLIDAIENPKAAVAEQVLIDGQLLSGNSVKQIT
ncbi:LacI family DNA-binding transcriptional regulator [Sinanaerobacter chloroacetimidivorans]|jgi:LacI family transcriptional regulator|uniref:LacI family DNA-binding transcriptional regulator n=1 Tax=Sinanaerobacter chloroacetimidivorans TaxID=2818044 RepID=A0A8J8B3K7_9FIRM|nr:LacI family DNA-binding transcriptional regulator [Sinanaerobacter chloroacetimidivorans]MBR0599857.1 LacI family DNA-binding transcriptional regulator [Sinanaerobacter chloroacetimidivorans]